MKRTPKRAFTLVETMIALTLMMLLAAGFLSVFSQGIRTWKMIIGNASTLQIENLVAERLCREIRSSVVLPSNGSELNLQAGPDLVSYQLVEGKIRRKKGTGSAYFTSEDEVKKLCFSYPSAGSVLVAIDNFSFRVAGRNR